MKPSKQLRPTEAQIQSQCRDYLALDGWRLVVTDPPHIRGLGVSEPGMPDDLYIRYGEKRNREFPEGEVDQVLWVEHKSKRLGSKAAQHQKNWHARERARGALVIVAGVDFEASLEGFAKWYEQSGLQRKRVKVSGC